MRLFDFLFGKKEGSSSPEKITVPVEPMQKTAKDEIDYLAGVEVAPGMVMPRVFAEHWDKIKETKNQCIGIKATASGDVLLTQSKFGHYPYLPVGYEYPKDEEGRYMFPLAQINFSEVPPLAGYPSSGYLQFYISAFDDLCGMDFDDLRLQKNFRVLYFEDGVIKDSITDFSFLEEALHSDMNPVYKPHALRFSTTDEYVGFGDIRYEKRVGEFDIEAVVEQYPELTKELEGYMWSNFQPSGHKIGGYAFFTQGDPRSGETEDYLLLLQIDTDEHIMWGDSGVGNFFIHPDDLAKKDFSKVMYTWDCC